MGTRKEKLAAFIRRQSADGLASVLLELAEALPEVQQRLARMQLADQPDRLAASFRKTLNGWRRQTRFLDYRASQEWAAEIQAWFTQVERELLPKDPMAVVALAETFIESDGTFFERADDSSGAIGGVMRTACLLWLQAAARCETPRDTWPARLRRLSAADRYGAREPLLLHADILLTEPQLREMVAELEREADGESTPSALDSIMTAGSRSTLTALTLLSRALRDPDVHVRATLRRSPQPNSMQKQDFVLQYLHADRPADALHWVEDPAGWYEPNRLRLLAEVLKRLGQTDRSAPIAQSVIEQSLDVPDLRTWLEHLAPDQHAEASRRARELALDHDDPVTAARLLVAIECWDDAEQVLVAEQARITGEDYVWLVPLAKALETQQCWRGATAVYPFVVEHCTPCPFCALPASRVLLRNESAITFRDAYPVAAGHTLVIPVRHVPSFFDTTTEERVSMLELLEAAKQQLHSEFSPAGYNIGINDGAAAGQTVGHLHIHLIPRYPGDRPDPRGGVRWVIPEKADYWTGRT